MTQQQLEQRAYENERQYCGDLKDWDSYPLSPQCINLFGKYAPVMQRKSDLTVAAKEACAVPESEKREWKFCMDVMNAINPNCAALAQANASGAPEKAGGPDMKPCFEAMAKNPACQSLMRAAAGDEETPQCKEAKQDLKDFQKGLESAEMQRVFAPPQ